ncbi:class I SAM-dependent methyltransferase [Patescibacteria group bacterium]|nr:class I SAM-dependent methyltransferase [Patescibacteria group bacterium]
MKTKIYKIVIKSALRLHSFSYKLSSFFSNKIEQGLHPKHRLMNYHKFFIDNINPRDTVLDIGCGNGALTFDVAKKAKKVIGIDLDEENIRFAKEMFSRKNIEYVQGDILENFPGKKFDVIILSNVLEHIKNRAKFLKVLKSKADKFLIRVPMINRDWITLYKKELGLEWMLDRGHFTEYTLESFQKELKKAGFKICSYSVQFGEIWSVVIK